MVRLKLIVLLVLWTVIKSITVNAKLSEQEVLVKSPDNKISAKVFVQDNRLTYSVIIGEYQVIKASSLGLMIDNTNLGLNVRISKDPVFSEINEDYPVFGSHSIAHNHANEASIPVENSGRKYNLIIRVYNDGVAIRYSIPEGSKNINGDSTTWTLPEDIKKFAWYDDYEGYSHVGTFEKVPQNKPVMSPMTIETGSYYISVSEADNENFSDMALVLNNYVLSIEFPVSKQGWEIRPLVENSPSTPQGIYKGQKVSPWRTIIIAENLSQLVNSDLLMNLCPAPEPGKDFSWVRPGRSLWQWWNVGAPVYEDQKNWYDAAAKLKWEYYLIDDGWRDWKQGDKDQWVLLKEVIAYGNSVGVKSMVWADSKEFRKAPERRAYLEKVKAAGAVGIKIDFIPWPNAEIMQWYLGTMQDCAEMKLILNFHGSVKPTGLTRTYPNDITREAVRGNEYQMTRYKRVMPFDQDVCLPFTRYMAGAADFTPVILDPKELATAKYSWAHEFAQAIVYLSPITHFCDQYSFYLESPIFDLFQEIPTVWNETRVLSCTEMGEVVAYARRKGNTWWLGVMNGEHEKEVKIPLDFLKNKAKATLVYDGLINTSTDRREQKVSHKDKLTIKMAPGGGFIARF